ncbi:unnamed protein product [Zymoseptoria tritici ST99CH_1A5]|uniref:Uncharacterized protein n=2 Tax=Zymoseptoria tritici TaxID=1047171 RepID=A0A2H1H9P0_ZYMTR|nr:unnamed protein product [Zymoseptoria tritici ST99CH_1E4]SMY30437.1 unnamed protein product [Zymoseptoria tritici ST99CH_1A5]
MEADFCNAERALDLLAHHFHPWAPLLYDAGPRTSPMLERVRGLLTCPPERTNTTSHVRQPNEKLFNEIYRPLVDHRDAIATQLETYATVLLPIYDSWFSDLTIIHDSLSSWSITNQTPPFSSSSWSTSDQTLSSSSSPFESKARLPNAVSSPCSSAWPNSPASVLSLAISLPCCLFSPTTLPWVQICHAQDFWSLRAIVLPRLANNLRTWSTRLPASLNHISLPHQPLSRLPTDIYYQRAFNATVEECARYNFLMDKYFASYNHDYSGFHPGFVDGAI